MNGRIIGFRFDCPQEPELCAAAMQRLLRILTDKGLATFDLFLYPYTDALLLSERGSTAMFGTHALLWGFDERALAEAAVEACQGRTALLRPRACLLDNDMRDIAAFFSEGVHTPAEGEVLVGGLASLLAGSVRPWAIREQSRRFCSFCEHLARTKGVQPVALCGDKLLIKSEEDSLAAVEELYAAKTGGAMEAVR
ncbi:MAG: hypothetical protein E7559_00395 [Ruminococcaceae bacterium]|nr:hypothetical protein [Oscillospiraceae bacterium]